MKTSTARPTLISMAVGVAFGAAITSTSVNAADREIILHDAIHDYNDGAAGTYSDPATHRVGGYRAEIILDESYHDYNSEEVSAYNESRGPIEQAEFAALEPGIEFPWVLIPQD